MTLLNRLKNLRNLANKKKINVFKLKPFGEKSKDYIKNSNAFINVQHGAIRSSKTTGANVSWLIFIKKHPFTDFLMTGNTQTSLYRNVLRPLMSLMDSWGIKYTYRKNEYLEIEGNTCFLMGFPNEGVANRIPGVTLGGWYADEINTYPKTLVELALDRLSEEGSRAFWTLNPTNPNHYIYADYIENEEKLAEGLINVWNYEIWDNPNLSQEYINRTLIRYPKGTTNYKRKILGLAAVEEGIIYTKFVDVEGQNTFIDQPYKTYDRYELSTDYGAGNVSVIGLFGIKFHANGNEYHLLNEYYYDATAPENNGVQLDDDELADNTMKKLLDNTFLLNKWWTPHDAASFRATLKKKIYMGRSIPVETYTPDVYNDIQEIQKLFANYKFKISKKNCPNSITQAQTYSWDPKAKNRGEDKPLKINDHCPDMWRAAILGSRQIKKSIIPGVG